MKRGIPVLSAAGVYFFAAGLAFIPLLGISNDESLFGSVVYAPSLAHTVRMFGADWRLMLMSYVGALKGWLYGPIFLLWAPSAYSIRVPALIVGLFTLWLFYKLVERASSERAAAIAVALLASDPLYLLTTVFDWGPVTLQHLLFVGGMFLGVRYYQEHRSRDLAGCFLCFGLGVWDKALFLWLLAGLGIAVLVVFRREFFSLISAKRIGVAAALFLLGALPLVLYNIQYEFATFRSDATMAPEEVAPKFAFLVEAVEEGVNGWMMPLDNDASGPPRENRPAIWIFVAAVASLPVLWRRKDSGARTMLFCLVAIAVAWLLMAITKNAGAGLHHIVLLWPLPHWLVALSLAALNRRIGMTLLASVVVVNLTIVSLTYGRMVRNGTTLLWTDAIFGLSRYLDGKTEEVHELDWGIHENLTLLNQGKLALRDMQFPAKEDLRQRMSAGALFVAHTDGNEIVKGVNANTHANAAELTLKRDLLATIPDSRGKPIFEVFRFKPAH